MTPFSASDAALEGFRFIRRRWRVVLGWAGFNLLMLVVLSVVLSLATEAASGSGPEPLEILGGLILGGGALVVQAVIAAGVLRVELRPDEPAFLHLRLGRDELRLIAILLFTLTGWWVVGWGAAMLGHALGLGPFWVFVLAVVVGIYLTLRFALAAPISFAEKRVDFPRSWGLTRGRVGGLLGMGALSFCLVALLIVVVFLVLALIALGSAGPEGLAGLFGGMAIVLAPVLWVLLMAPFAAAYRAFVEPPAD